MASCWEVRHALPPPVGDNLLTLFPPAAPRLSDRRKTKPRLAGECRVAHVREGPTWAWEESSVAESEGSTVTCLEKGAKVSAGAPTMGEGFVRELGQQEQ